jgi:hypothetical protein
VAGSTITTGGTTEDSSIGEGLLLRAEAVLVFEVQGAGRRVELSK